MIYFVNGQFVKKSEAFLPVGDIVIGRGYGIFDYYQMKEGVHVYRSEHLDRFLRSCKAMRITIPQGKSELIEITDELKKVNNIKDAGIKLIATGGVSSDGFSLSNGSLVVQVLPYFEPTQEVVEKGVKLLSFEFQRLLPTIKSTNYLYNVYLSEQLQAAGAMEPLYYTSESVRETARANVFAVKNGTLITPDEKLLSGINREKVLKLGYPHELRNITIEELKSADEVFLTGTTKRALAVRQIDEHIIGNGKPGPVTQKIREQLLLMEKDMIASALQQPQQ